METVKQESWRRTLEVALDGAAMAAYLGPRLPACALPPSGLVVTDLALIDHKPGRRGLVRYELSAREEQQRHVVFGKLYGDRGQLLRVNHVLHALHGGMAQAGLPDSVPQPLGVIPELSMLVYKPVDGCFLDEAIARGGGAATLELTGRWLGVFHRQPLAAGQDL